MFPVPTNLSPSRVDAFLTCPMAFRFSSIEKLPEPPSPHTTKGSLVHRALELLFALPAVERTLEAADRAYAAAADEYRTHPDFTGLGLDDAAADEFFADGLVLTRNYFAIEDPASIDPVGLELWLEGPVGSVTMRGIIDRLERDADGRLVITDYKTGKAPSGSQQAERFGALHFYAHLCEQKYGERPASVRLMYLRSGTVLTAVPSDSSMKLITNRATAVHRAITMSCTTGQFATKKSGLCSWCAFQDWCPAFGGDPDLARVEAPQRYGPRT